MKGVWNLVTLWVSLRWRLRWRLRSGLSSGLSFFGLTVFGACAGMMDYVAPAQGPLATLTFDSESRTGMSSASDSYLNFAFRRCLGGDASYVKVPPKRSETVRVRAQEPLYLSLTTTARGGSGTVHFSFVPDNGATYRIVYRELPGPSGASSMEITLFDAAGRELALHEGTKDWPRCWSVTVMQLRGGSVAEIDQGPK